MSNTQNYNFLTNNRINYPVISKAIPIATPKIALKRLAHIWICYYFRFYST
jgi:hypothetical protein